LIISPEKAASQLIFFKQWKESGNFIPVNNGLLNEQPVTTKSLNPAMKRKMDFLDLIVALGFVFVVFIVFLIFTTITYS